MSSPEWETVTKSKKQKNLEKKISAHNELKRLAAIPPTLEEILPPEEYRNLIISGAENINDRPSPAKSTSSSSNKSKSPQKSNKTKELALETKKTAQQSKKTGKQKSLEAALREITKEDFNSQLELLKLSYPGAELLWLKGIANYLNMRLPFDCDPTFSGKSVRYPTNLMPKTLRMTMIDFLESVGVSNLEYFYHTLLTNMTTDLSKNQLIVGYKFLLQLMTQKWPEICSNNMAKTALLRNSYQNRSNICLTILWAVGQGGYQNLPEGLKVWQNLMLPNLEMKSYTKFITEYVKNIIISTKGQKLVMDQITFFSIYRSLTTSYNIPKEYQNSLTDSAAELLQLYIACSSKHANIFLTLLRDIEHPKQSRNELEGCISCLTHGPSESFKVWKMNYKKQLTPSLLLLQKLDEQWDDDSFGDAKYSESFQNFLLHAKTVNDVEKRSRKHIENLVALDEIIMTMQDKVSAQKQRRATQSANKQKKCGGCCKWLLGSAVLAVLIGVSLNYYTEVNGNGVFANTGAGKALANAGLLPYIEKAWYTTMGVSARGYKWAEMHVPPYAKPAGVLAVDLYKLMRNTACNAFGVVREAVKSKLPIASNFLEQYVPGLPQKIGNFADAVTTGVQSLWSKIVEFVNTQVLIGRLSPENLSKALNNTQNAALRYYNIFHKKVDVYAKLK